MKTYVFVGLVIASFFLALFTYRSVLVSAQDMVVELEGNGISINSSNQILISSGNTAYVWKDGNTLASYTPTDSLLNVPANPGAFSDTGEFVGWNYNMMTGERAFYYRTSVQAPEFFPEELEGQPIRASRAYAVSNQGDVLGTFRYTSDPSCDVLFVKTGGGFIRTIPYDSGLLGCALTMTSINDTGYATGYSSNGKGFLIDTNKTADHITVLEKSGWTNIQPMTVGNQNIVVGFGVPNGGMSQAFKWQGGVFTELQALAGGVSTEAYDINNLGQIVGKSYVYMGTDLTYRAVIWKEGTITDLGSDGTIVDAETNTAISTQYDSLSINDAGLVVGTAFIRIDSDTSYAYINKPVIYDYVVTRQKKAKKIKIKKKDLKLTTTPIPNRAR